MYSKQELSLTRQQFWTAFGQYLSPVLSAEGEKINWVNYKTGVKHIRFSLEVENNAAVITLEFNHPEKADRENAWIKMNSLKKEFENMMGEAWKWERNKEKDHRLTDQVSKELLPVNIMDKNDWPALISFFKCRLLLLDRFWSAYKLIFEI